MKPDSETTTYASPWALFQYEMFKQYMQNAGQASAFVSLQTTRQKVQTLTGLWADTQYVCWGYVEDQNQNFSLAGETSFTTSEMPNAAVFEMSFAGDVPDNKLSDLAKVVGVGLGV